MKVCIVWNAGLGLPQGHLAVQDQASRQTRVVDCCCHTLSTPKLFAVLGCLLFLLSCLCFGVHLFVLVALETTFLIFDLVGWVVCVLLQFVWLRKVGLRCKTLPTTTSSRPTKQHKATAEQTAKQLQNHHCRWLKVVDHYCSAPLITQAADCHYSRL